MNNSENPQKYTLNLILVFAFLIYSAVIIFMNLDSTNTTSVISEVSSGN